MHRLGHPSLRPMGLAGQPGLGGLDVGIYHRAMATRPQNLIKFHPLWESSGAVAVDYSWRRNDGTHVGVTLGEPGSGDGRLSSFYDALLDYTNIYSAGFAADFNGAEGTVMAWINTTAWNDGVGRYLWNIWTDGANNRLSMRSSALAAQLDFYRTGGGVTETVSHLNPATGQWIHVAQTWSQSQDKFIAYYRGKQTGPTQTALGVWNAGVWGATAVCIGSQTTAPLTPFSGGIGFWLCWNAALTADEIAFNARRM